MADWHRAQQDQLQEAPLPPSISTACTVTAAAIATAATCGGGGQPHRGLWWWRDSIPTVERCALPTQCSFFRWNCRTPDRPPEAPRKLATPTHQILRLGCVGLLPTSTLHVRSPHTPLLLALAGYKSTSPKEAGSGFLEWVFAEVEKDESKERRAKRKLQKGFFDRAGR